MNRDILFRAKRKDNGEWLQGFYVKCRGHHYILPVYDEDHGFDERYSDWAEVGSETVCRCSGKEYMNGEIAYEGDIYKNPECGVVFVLKYGTYTAYCPADDTYMDNVGFYAEAEDYPQMPIGDLSTYALKIGNIFDNPELMEVEM